MLWMSQPITANILGTILVTVQFILFFNQSFSCQGGVQLFTNALPFTPEATKCCASGKSEKKNMITLLDLMNRV
jgi:hypothetical protein